MEGCHQPAATIGILQQRSAAAAKSQSAAADGTGQLEGHEQAKGACPGGCGCGSADDAFWVPLSACSKFH
jgi:hypothetical protein